MAQAALGARHSLEHASRGAWLGIGVDQLERAGQQSLLTHGVAVQVGRVGGPHQQFHLVAAGALFGVGHPLPQGERSLVQAQRLAEGIHPLGGAGGPHRGGKGGRLVARGEPVVGHSRGHVRPLGLVLQPLLERARHRAVQVRPLAGQQIVVDHLAEQRVAEVVAALAAGHHDVARHGLADGVAQRLAAEPGQLGQQRLVSGLAGKPAQHGACGGGERVHPEHEGIAQRGRQCAAAVEAGGQQLLGEQRVALAAGVQALDQVGRG